MDWETLWHPWFDEGDGAGSGGSGDTETDESEGEGEGDPADDPEIGEKGKRAIAAERAARKKAEREAKAAQRDLARLRASKDTGDDDKIAAAKNEARTEAIAAANKRIVKAEAKAMAAGKLANPELAPRLLDLEDIAVDDDGNVDTKALAAALDELVEEYPNLGVKGETKRSGPGTNNGSKDKASPTINDALRAMAGRSTK